MGRIAENLLAAIFCLTAAYLCFLPLLVELGYVGGWEVIGHLVYTLCIGGVALVLLFAVWIAATIRETNDENGPHGICSRWGYDLRGLDPNRCPDCGKPLPIPVPKEKPEEFLRRLSTGD